jgi:hypothetical protein
MKIIKEGRLPQEKVYRTSCGNCGTVFEFKEAEAKYTCDQRDGDFYTLHCPLRGCGAAVALYTSRLTAYEVAAS